LHRPDPTRGAVDGCLAEADFRVGHESSLTEPKDSAQASGRSRRQAAAAVFLAGVLSVGVGACGNADVHDATPGETGSPVATAPATQTEEAPASARVEAAVLTPATFSGPVADQFGTERVQSAYTEVGEYLTRTSFNEDLLHSNPAPTADKFELATQYMTPSIAADYRTTVQKALAGDEAAGTDLNSMSFYDIESDDAITPPSGGQIVTGHSVSNPQVSVSEQGSLKMTVTETATWHLNQNGSPIQTPVTKTSTFYLTPNDVGGPPPWLINGISSNWASGQITAD